MKRINRFLIILFFSVFIAGTAVAQDFMIYPAKGQSQDQMEKDKFECYSWAKGQTGFDPMEMPKATAPPPSKKATSSTAGGAVKGEDHSLLGYLSDDSSAVRQVREDRRGGRVPVPDVVMHMLEVPAPFTGPDPRRPPTASPAA